MPGRGSRRDWVRHGLLTTTLPIACYLVLVVGGITTSHIGIDSLRADPGHPDGFMLGKPKAVRSDEWLTVTPLELGVIASGSTHTASELAQDFDLLEQIPSGDVIETLIFADGAMLKLGPVLPDASVFAAYVWLPFLLLVLFAPRWLQRLGARKNLAWLATAMIVLSPSSMWWSYQPIRILGFVFAGGYLMMLSADRLRAGRLKPALAYGAVSAVLLARIPTNYVPWSVTLAIPIVLAGGLAVMWKRENRKSAIIAVGGIGVLSLALFGGFLWENWSAWRAELATVYPGLRRTSGAALDPAQLFAAPGLSPLQRLPDMTTLNYSEISSSFTVAFFAAAVVWVAAGRLDKDLGRVAVITLSASVLLWLSWSMVSWGSLGEKLPLLNFVEPRRASATIGFLALLVLALILSRRPPSSAWRIPITAGLVCTGVTAYGVSYLRQAYIPTMAPSWMAASALAVGGIVAALIRWPDRWVPVGAAVLLAAIPVATVNPVLVGLGDLRDSPAAQYMLGAGEAARADHSWWATNSMIVDALLVATGVPSLSGHQVTGPVRSQWLKLDPSGQYEPIWNRGSSYILMEWTQGPTTLELPSPDVILVKADPCRLAADGLGLTHVVSTIPLTNPCVTLTSTLTFSGAAQYVYALNDA